MVFIILGGKFINEVSTATTSERKTNSPFGEIPETREELEKQLSSTQKHAYSPGTIKNFFCQWKSFLRFSEKYKICEWPVSEHVLSLYGQYLAFSFHSPKAVRTYMLSIKTLHVLLRERPPNMKDIEIRLTLRALNKIMAHEPKQALPLTPEILLDMFDFIDLDLLSDKIFWGILLVGFWGMFRKSNLVSDSRHSFDPTKQLTVGHISFVPGMAVVKVTWAKNIQNRERALEIPLFEVEGSPLCPVRILKLLVTLQQRKIYPLFGNRKVAFFSYNQFQKKLRLVLNKAGYRGKDFSSHSMRRGGAAWAHRSGVPESLIQVHGGWKSDVYKTYLNFPIEVRAAVALKMHQTILDIKI